MKKFKKILSAVSAAVLCALPTVNGVAANAADEYEKLNTYRVYVEVKPNSGICKCTVETRYVDNMTFIEEQIGNLGGEVSSARLGRWNIGDGTMNQYVECYYKTSGDLALEGTLFTMKYISRNTYEDNESTFEIYNENSRGIKLSDDLVSRKAVLIGDANNDGRVDMSDAVLIDQFLKNPSRFPLNARAADTNNDGVITDEDATLIQKYLLQLIECF